MGQQHERDSPPRLCGRREGVITRPVRRARNPGPARRPSADRDPIHLLLQGIALGQRFNVLLIEPDLSHRRVQFLRDGGKLVEIERGNHNLARVVFQKAPVGERNRRAGRVPMPRMARLAPLSSSADCTRLLSNPGSPSVIKRICPPCAPAVSSNSAASSTALVASAPGRA